jgi:hypothetical protein
MHGENFSKGLAAMAASSFLFADRRVETEVTFEEIEKDLPGVPAGFFIQKTAFFGVHS